MFEAFRSMVKGNYIVFGFKKKGKKRGSSWIIKSKGQETEKTEANCTMFKREGSSPNGLKAKPPSNILYLVLLGKYLKIITIRV